MLAVALMMGREKTSPFTFLPCITISFKPEVATLSPLGLAPQSEFIAPYGHPESTISASLPDVTP